MAKYTDDDGIDGPWEKAMDVVEWDVYLATNDDGGESKVGDAVDEATRDRLVAEFVELGCGRDVRVQLSEGT